MSFMKRVIEFIENPSREHANQDLYDVMKETLEYMLDSGAMGIENAISTKEIVNHLNSVGYDIHRERWEIEVLGYLRDNGVYIASKIGRGMYLIKSKRDAQEAYNFIHSRVQRNRSDWIN